ncbi:hypothetical protein [Actinomadura decatromicini]|uniref:GH26 domain-containing protein n=1 Tax=Actinomadura decatromicini TaxID=2604572 RepID=A0A5D3F807_9ACTN|nr:hypothetical protein [Actinomadura decatromicini]TYK45147.1 hypothetical protein FXF68_31190 [Actinomadura decatromicini]
MPAAKVYVLSGGRLLPLAGGPAIIPPTAGSGNGGTPGGGDPGTGNRNAMLVGAAGTSLSGSDFPALDQAAGPFTVRRSYDTALPATFAASVAGIDVNKRASVWSCKPDLGQLAAGTLDSAIRAFVQSIPDTHVCWLTCWHEPDGKIRKSQFTLAQYLPAFRRFCQVVKSVGKAHVYTTQILEAWSGQQPKAGSTYSDLWPGAGYVDCYGVDGYSNTGSGSTLWKPAVDFATSKGIPWGIAEVGCATTADTAWMQAQADYAGATSAGGGRSRAAYFCWFSNSTGGVLPTPGSDPSMQAKAKTISQAYFTDVNAYLL